MKRFLTVAVAMLALTGMGQVAMRKLEDLTNTNLVCVTDYGPQVASLTARVTRIEGSTNDWSKTVLNLAALSNNVAGLSSRAAETNELFSAWFSGLQSRTSYWDTAYSWGDWSTAGLATTQQLAAAVAGMAAHTNRTDNPHGVTAPQIGAITNEADLAALRAYHYGSPDIVESPAEWFVFDGAGTITAFNWAPGRENVVIPWAIGGVPVTGIGVSAFHDTGNQTGFPVTSVIAPQTVTMIGDSAFYFCTSLASVYLPQVTSIGEYAFAYCGLLASVPLPQVTSIGNGAFGGCSSLASVLLPQGQTVGDYAFNYCTSLASVSLPQGQTVGDYAFDYCTSLASVSLPQATAIGNYAFGICYSLASVSLPQATTIGEYAFYYCNSLTAIHMGRNAPAEATGVFADITTPPTVYVTDPQATGWGDTWNGAPVVRPPLYGSNVTAQAYTLNGDTITEWPAGGGGGGETSIIAPLYESGTNVTVTSTQSVYSVSVTNAGPVGIDWSGLALDGTGRAEITLRLNVTNWAGTNVTFAPSLTFDQTPKILVTGVWEFAASTIDGVTTRVSQTWPEVYAWMSVTPNAHMLGNAEFYYGGGSNPDLGTINGGKLLYPVMTAAELLLRFKFSHAMTELSAGTSLAKCKVSSGTQTAFILTNVVQTSAWNSQLPPRFAIVPASVDNATLYGEHVILERVIDDEDNTNVHLMLNLSYRQLNANERAAYAAGWRP